MIIIMWVVLLLSKWNYDLDDAKICEQFENDNRKKQTVSKNHADRCAIPPDLRSGDYNFSPNLIFS